MKQPHPHQDITVIVTTGYDADGYPETQVAPLGEGGTNIPAESRHPYGFIGRPADAVQDEVGNVTNGAFVKTEKEGSTLHSYAMDDPRVTGTLPALPKGGSMHYGPGPAWARFDDIGNYRVHVPGAATVVIETESGPSITISGAVVQIGDGSAAPLAHSAEVLEVFSGLVALLGTMNSAPITPWEQAVAVAANTLSGIITPALATLPTTKTTGT